jgi:hypothetical protein
VEYKDSFVNKPIVFLSHSSKDKAPLLRFKDWLDARTGGTINFFLSSDGESIPFGSHWVATVEENLKKAKLAFLFLTLNSVNSSWVAFEAGYMFSNGLRVVPVGLPGIDIGTIKPPLQLLQGFNLHSPETMNNVVKIVNDVFGHKHQFSFEEKDFRTIFGTDSKLASGYFGEYTQLVRLVRLHGRGHQDVLSPLKKELSKQNIDLVVGPREIGEEGAAPGIGAISYSDLTDEEDWYYNINIAVDQCGEVLPIASDIVARLGKKDVGVEILFVRGLTGVGDDVTTTSKAFGTELKVLPQGKMEFRGITIGGGVTFNPLHLRSTKPMTAETLRELITLLFNRRILEFTEEKPKMFPAHFGGS